MYAEDNDEYLPPGRLEAGGTYRYWSWFLIKIPWFPWKPGYIMGPPDTNYTNDNWLNKTYGTPGVGVLDAHR